MKRLTVAAAALALAAALAAGCSSIPAKRDADSTPVTSSAPATSAAARTPHSGASSAPATGSTQQARNALTLTGPARAATVPDMKPVVTGVAPSLPATVTDARGKQITVTSAKRVLSLDLYGTLTDTVIGLGLGEHLVGRAASDTQAALADLPVVTRNGLDLNTEAVLSLRPDLILTNMTIGSRDSYRQLEAAGVSVVRFDETPSIDAIPAAIKKVGQAFGMRAQAARLARHTETRMKQVRAKIDSLRSATPRKPRAAVLYVRGSGGIFFILGADYGASDVLNALGLDDVAADHGITNLKPANAEALVSLNPQILLSMTGGVKSAGGVDNLLSRPGIAATAAGKNRRIITAPDSQLLSYGPRTPESLLALARAIYTGNGR